ncbi:Sec1-binding region of Mso1-domain-containing protein [Lasiosphaeris hirsuta]|uniref:Sec1-binding region of Mso1-domain-containing protein n=1 Tax=Lasiosphaeris hirsuta TaxID=260670 RepID=A0AA40AR83_9PEZI|nr:Sec1-binding region of Mso1-domain-containing protein [Lasiosphaeris hirsuta]
MSWYSNIITNASSNITKLQRTYFGGETDGDTEDDTHVCRVLRGYYAEKGQPFPGWLPPDPKAPPPVQPVFASQQPQVGSRYGGLAGNNPPQQGGGGGALSSLWDTNNNAAQPNQPASLRQGNRFGNRGGSGDGGPQLRPPLPNQRGGSYQAAGTTPPGSSSSGSAQEKLKQRLWGGGARTVSPAGAGPFQPPPAQQQQAPPPQSSGRRWGSNSGNGGSGAGGGNYEDKPVMSANAPWASGGFDYYSEGGDYSAPAPAPAPSGGGRPVGLPSGSRRGLPSGPRMR